MIVEFIILDTIEIITLSTNVDYQMLPYKGDLIQICNYITEEDRQLLSEKKCNDLLFLDTVNWLYKDDCSLSFLYFLEKHSLRVSSRNFDKNKLEIYLELPKGIYDDNSNKLLLGYIHVYLQRTFKIEATPLKTENEQTKRASNNLFVLNDIDRIEIIKTIVEITKFNDSLFDNLLPPSVDIKEGKEYIIMELEFSKEDFEQCFYKKNNLFNFLEDVNYQDINLSFYTDIEYECLKSSKLHT